MNKATIEMLSRILFSCNNKCITIFFVALFSFTCCKSSTVQDDKINDTFNVRSTDKIKVSINIGDFSFKGIKKTLETKEVIDKLIKALTNIQDTSTDKLGPHIGGILPNYVIAYYTKNTVSMRINIWGKGELMEAHSSGKVYGFKKGEEYTSIVKEVLSEVDFSDAECKGTGPVCGQPPTLCPSGQYGCPPLIRFSNICLFIKAKAKLIKLDDMSKCKN